MFHSLAPTGLSPPTRRKVVHFDHNLFCHQFVDFLKDFESQLKEKPGTIDFHGELTELVKFVKKLLMEGLYEKYASFWPFVMNFLPHLEQKRIKDLCRRQDIGVFWIMESVQDKTLTFQLQSLIISPVYLLNRYYDKRALIRDKTKLAEVLGKMDKVFDNEINFNTNFEPLTNNGYENIPIASVNGDLTHSYSLSQLPSSKRSYIFSASPTRVESSIDFSGSIGGDLPVSLSLIEMTRDLPPVDVHDIPANHYDAHFLDIIHEHVSAEQLEENEPEPSFKSSDDVAVNSHVRFAIDNVEQNTPEKTSEVTRTNSEISHQLAFDSGTENFSASECISGEFVFDPAEIIQLGATVFESGEFYRESFRIFMNHATGSPEYRVLTITDRYLYEFIELGRNSHQVTHSVKLNMIDYMSIGVDYQCITIHCTGQKFKAEHSEHIVKNFTIETASMQMGKKIIWCIKKACLDALPTDDIPQVYTKGTEAVVTLQRFIHKQISSTNPIIHHALIYWKEAASIGQTDEIEGYVRIRKFKPGLFRSYGEWNEVYASIKGGMLYQFTDLSCKEAISVTQLRENLSCVFEVELQNDEKWILQISSTNQDGEIQLACATRDEMRKWMQAINLSLDIDAQDELVPCTMTICGTSVVLAQEGDNFTIDGFMRALKIFRSVHDVKNFVLLSRNSVYSMILVNQDYSTDWFYVRNESELDRLEQTLKSLECNVRHLEFDREYPFLLPHLHKLQTPFVQG